MNYSDELLTALEEERALAAEGVGAADLGVALAQVLWRLAPLLPMLASAVRTLDAQDLDDLRTISVEFAGATFELALAMDPELRELDLSDPAGVRQLLVQLPDVSANWTTESTVAECLVEWAGSLQADLTTLGQGLSRGPGERGLYVRNAVVLVRDALDLTVYLDELSASNA